ncbi:MAG: 4Fe-4S binding protein [Acidobacteria bacterium]|nr:4Fe-4S binding protein [Acidobacteriota bacterium]
MTSAEKKPKKKPKWLAVIDESGCTGCEVCIYFCPVADGIIKLPGPEFPSVNAVCRVVDEQCIGCGACARACPWEAIQMLPLLSPAPQPNIPAGAPTGTM